MANVRDIRRRIRGIQSTEQITKAMQMVAAAKVRRAQERLMATRPYADKFTELYRALVAQVPPTYESPLMENRPLQRVALVVITSDKGLSGSYNANIIRKALAQAKDYSEKGISVSFIVIGSKGVAALKRSPYPIMQSYQSLPAIPTPGEARGIVEDIVAHFVAQEVDRVELIYTRFQSMLRYTPVVAEFLPASLPEAGGVGETLFEPTPEAVLDRMIPKYLETEVYRDLLEAAASQLASQMTAMSNASKSAADMIRMLTIVYNKARQAMITQEISEVVGGANALKG